MTGQNVHVIGQNIHVTGQNVHVTGQNVHVTGQNVHATGQNIQMICQVFFSRFDVLLWSFALVKCISEVFYFGSLTIFVELAFGVFPIPKGWNDYSKAVRFRTKSRRDDIIIKRLRSIMSSLRDFFHRCVSIL